MREIKTIDAVGHIICHDITQITPGVSKGVAFKKGHMVREEDIPKLFALGKDHLFVWQADENTMHENEAADILYRLCAGENIRPTEVREGKIDLIAMADGLLEVDTERLRKINSLGEIMVATRHGGFAVKKDEMLAGTRAIPLVISKAKMRQAEEIAGGRPIITVREFRLKKCAIITTGNEVFYGRTSDKFTPVVKEKLAEFGGEVICQATLPDEYEKITTAINECIASGAELVVCTGGMSVDPDDRTPLAIKNTGAAIVSYGAPVLPGAMFMLAYHKSGCPVVGLPGCAMYTKRTVFDLVLPKLMAKAEITKGWLANLGHGGLCLNCPVCVFPACSFGK